MSTKVLKIELFPQKMLWLLAGCLLVVLGLYIYLANNLIFEVTERAALIRERAEHQLVIGELEGRYLKLDQSLTIERAYTLGFEEAGANLSFAAVIPTLLALGTAGGHEE
ncbi:MAG: hypothetical protein HYT47_00930 [Candidatus Vogelbacteria bacterium]|nr:hypothetical protein [Candidatus Vogelbacteria bacterium]